MAAVCTPVTIVTTMADGQPCGATVSSFASLSLTPPLVSVAFDRRSTVLARIRTAGRFAVSLLGHGQEGVATLFATPGADRFTGTAWYADRGLPRLEAAAGWMTCHLHQVVEAGDHLMLLGLVTHASRTEMPPLVYAHRVFGTHSRYGTRARTSVTDLIAACSR